MKQHVQFNVLAMGIQLEKFTQSTRLTHLLIGM